ncbi:DUF1858 domain-containing protein [Candidatus Woesearchaeota archaeon]|nr:DUF1858 domain-containing protein [Candidatus Woesearchaeota archaeon]
MQITKDTLIGDLVKQKPESVNVLMKHGMHCIGCSVATWETLEQACQSHGISVNNLVGDLKEVKKK